MLIQIKDGKSIGHPVLESNFRQMFSNISFPQFFTPELVESFGFGMYDFTTQPEPGKYQKAVEAEPVKDEKGIYRQTWVIVDMSEEEKEYEDIKMASEMRQIRTMRLAGSDWTQVADAPVDKAAWSMYRQALRDITTQAGFPWAVEWPTQPE